MARVGRFSIFGLFLQACIASNAQPVSDKVPQVGAGVGININGGRQSETALAVSQSFLFTGVIAFFNDFSVSTINPLFDGTTYKRGYSIQGWSTTFDYGLSWEYRGKSVHRLVGQPLVPIPRSPLIQINPMSSMPLA